MDHDNVSHLDRKDMYRLSVGIGKKHYQHLFGNVPKRPAKGEIISNDVDFKATGILMPHPIYAWLGWVCINNPDEKDKPTLAYLLDISYQSAIIKFRKKNE